MEKLLSLCQQIVFLHINLQDETNKYQRNGMNTGIRGEKAIKYNLGKQISNVQHLTESEHKYQTIILILKKSLNIQAGQRPYKVTTFIIFLDPDDKSLPPRSKTKV